MDVDDNQTPHPRHFVQTISSCGICLLDPDGRIAQRNTGAERLYGYRAGDVVGQDFAVLFSAHEQQLGAPATALRLARRTGRAEQVSQRRRKDGTTFWPVVCTDAVRDDADRFIGLVDVTYATNQQHSRARALTESEERFRRLIFPENRGGEIEIDFRRGSGSQVILSVSDNRIGLPGGFSLANVSTLGMQLLSLLADQIGAEMSIRPSHPTQFSLRFRIG